MTIADSLAAILRTLFGVPSAAEILLKWKIL